jgi:hypothetical protein
MQYLTLIKEVHRKDAGETFGSGVALNLEKIGRGQERNSGKGISKSKKV